MPYPRPCPVCSYMAVSDLAFRCHLMLHHHMMVEIRDGGESFRQMNTDEAAQRSHTIRNRRRGRRCRLQAEASSRRPSPVAEAAAHLRMTVQPTIFRLDTYPTLRVRDAPAGGNGEHAGVIVCRPDFCVGGPVGAASPAADNDAVGGQTSPVRQHGV